MKRKQKKNTLVLLSAASLAAISTLTPNPALADIATLSAQAVIGKGIGATFTTNLDFGYLAAAGTPSGTVTLNPNTNIRTTSGALSTSGGGQGFGVLQVGAVKSAAITLSVTALPVLKHSTQTSKTMTMDRFDIRDTDAGTSQALTVAGTLTFTMATATSVNNFNVGGRLRKSGGTTLPAGTYKSSAVTFNVDYQ